MPVPAAQYTQGTFTYYFGEDDGDGDLGARVTCTPLTSVTPGTGATTTGAVNVTFTAGASIFFTGHIGKLIRNDSGAGLAVITALSSGTVVLATILTAFPSLSAIGSGSWTLGVAVESVAAENMFEAEFVGGLLTFGSFDSYADDLRPARTTSSGQVLTPGVGATVEGATDVDFTSSVAMFLSTDVGLTIESNIGRGFVLITSYISSTHIRGTVLEAFESLNPLLPLEWSVSNVVIDTGNGVKVAFNGAGFIEKTLFPTGTGTGTNGAGRYPISGTAYLDARVNNAAAISTTTRIRFHPPIQALGFYAIDLGDFAGAGGEIGKMRMRITMADNTVIEVSAPNLVNTGGAPPAGGSMSYFGIINRTFAFKKIQFYNETAGFDVWGLDSFSTGTLAEVSLSPTVKEQVVNATPGLSSGNGLSATFEDCDYSFTQQRLEEQWQCCDRCGFLYSLSGLVVQQGYIGGGLTVCRRHCLDEAGHEELKPVDYPTESPLAYVDEEGPVI
jgi:hypothetical protein